MTEALIIDTEEPKAAVKAKKAEPPLSKEELVKQPLLSLPNGSKKVRLVRRNTSRLPDLVHRDAITKIGSEWQENTRSMIRGLDSFEEAAYLPHIIQVLPNSPNWEQALQEYWADYGIRVPADGLVLEIWTDKNGNPSKANLKDYISYQFCNASSKVAFTKEEVENKGMFPFFIEDSEQKTKTDFEALQITKKASLLFLKLFDRDSKGSLKDQDKIDWVMELYKRTDSEMGLIDAISIENKEIYMDKRVKDNSELFISFVEDIHLQEKAFITKCLTLGVLTKIGNAILDGEHKIGDGLDEAVYYLTDPKNSKLYITLKERMKQLSKIR